MDVLTRRCFCRASMGAKALVAVAFVFVAPLCPGQDPDRLTLSETVELPRLLDLVSQRLSLNLEFDRDAVKGAVTLRLAGGVSDEELWALTNRLLAARGLTTVQMAGEGNLSVVKLQDAEPLARLEPDDALARSRAGFVRAMRPIGHADPASVVEALASLTSKPGGSVRQLGQEPWIVVADLRPRAEQILAVLVDLDARPASTAILEVPVAHRLDAHANAFDVILLDGGALRRDRRGDAAMIGHDATRTWRGVAAALVLLALCACKSGHSGAPYEPLDPDARNPQRAQELSREADALAEQDPASAEQLYRNALEADLYHGPAHNNLGVLYLHQGRLYEAAGEFDWARRLLPGHPDPRFNLGLTLEAAGRHDEALDTYATALEVFPRHVPTTQALASLALRTDRVDEEVREMVRWLAAHGESSRWRERAKTQSARLKLSDSAVSD